MMKINVKEALMDKINKSEWWHVTPGDPDAYKKRGKFLASTYQQAEFYGRPNDVPEKVSITNPVYGFSEKEILTQLFPEVDNSSLLDNFADEDYCYQQRIELDAAMFKKAKSLGYDAIVLMTQYGRKALERNRKPHSIELNVLDV